MSLPAQLSLALPDAPVDAPEIRRSRRARRLSIQVFVDGRAEVVAPEGASERAIERFIADHTLWLEQARAEQLRRYRPVDRSRPVAIELCAVNERWRLVRRAENGDRLKVTLRPDDGPGRFVLCIDGAASADQTLIKDKVRRRLIERARTMFAAEIEPLAREMQSRYTRLQVRDQKTCWGSYSGRGTLSMNYAALFLAPALMHYLCVHELAHAHHMNHSPAFWRCVERQLPGGRRLDRQLGHTQQVVPPWLWT